MGRTVSERAFEEYLSKRGIMARYEELPSGITQPVDYSFELAGQTLRFDVKEWEPKKPHPGVGSFDPYEFVRDKIHEGREKFKQYKGRGEPCVLVLCHYGPQLIMLDAISIFGAMYGNLGWVFPFNPGTCGKRDVPEILKFSLILWKDGMLFTLFLLEYLTGERLRNVSSNVPFSIGS